MWLILGLLAIVFTCINLLRYKIGRDYKLAMLLGLSFTALTLCAEYTMVSRWVIAEDWSALMDVVPFMDNALWFLTICSIVLNSLPILMESIKKYQLKQKEA